MGNGQKAAMRREKIAAGKKGAGASQLKSNEQAKSVQCTICRQTFLQTVRRKALEEHLSSKHDGKTFESCFPTFSD